jgi:hypothetical protein
LLTLQKWTVNHNWPSDIFRLVLVVKCQSISRILCEESLSATGVFAVAAAVVVVVVDDSQYWTVSFGKNEVNAANTFGLTIIPNYVFLTHRSTQKTPDFASMHESVNKIRMGCIREDLSPWHEILSNSCLDCHVKV